MVKFRDVAIVAGLIALGGGIFFGGRALSKSISDFKLPELPSLPDIKFPDITLPVINLPDITLPEINFPEFKFPDIFGNGNGVTQVTTPAPPDFVPLTPEQQEKLPGPCSIVQDEFGNVTRICAGDESPPMDLISSTPPPPPSPPLPEIVVDPFLETEGEFMGGGPSFIGGSIGQNPVDTFFEVLDLFPGLSATGAANFLEQFSGISPEKALGLSQFEQFQDGAA